MAKSITQLIVITIFTTQTPVLRDSSQQSLNNFIKKDSMEHTNDCLKIQDYPYFSGTCLCDPEKRKIWYIANNMWNFKENHVNGDSLNDIAYEDELEREQETTANREVFIDDGGSLHDIAAEMPPL
jgi:hypothetical protein